MNLMDKYIEEAIIELVGKEGLSVYLLLKNKENYSEFLLSEKLKININQIRNILYKFDSQNLVSFTRKKDRKKGWYIYYWTFRHDQINELIKRKKLHQLKIIDEQIMKEKTVIYYSCPNKCVRMTIEDAMEYAFVCPECGSIFNPDDSSKRMQKLNEEKKEIQELLDNFEKAKIKAIPVKTKKNLKKKKTVKKKTKSRK